MVDLRATWVAAAGAALLLGLAAAACGGSGDGGGGGQAAAGASSSGGGSGAGGGFHTQSCDPPCQPPQFCSVTGVCLDAGQCATAEDCLDGEQCTDAGTCSGCNPPNMLIDLDRSCSMKGKVNGVSKWQLAVDAINKLTTDYLDTIRFGLTLFPDTVKPNCQQDVIPIPIGPGNEPAIQTLLTASLANSDPNFPSGPCVTNIDTAMQQATTEPAFDDVTRQGYVLLITDGKQYGCNAAGGDAGTTQIIGDLYQQRGIATFVVGFGAGVDPAQLNIFADAGGVPTNDASCSPEPCRFYKAEDGASLEAALEAIAAAVSCDPSVH